MGIIRKPFKYSFFNATAALIGINIVFYFFLLLFPRFLGYLSLSYYGLKLHYYWQPLTYLFVHSGLTHIIFNMLALFFFGFSVEKAAGSKEFLCLYFFCGILDGLFSVFFYLKLGKPIFLAGASGAVYSLLFAYAVIFPRNVIYIWGIIPVSAPLLVLVYAIIEILSQIPGRDGIAHLTHLSGFALAYLYFVVRMGINPVKVWKDTLK